VFSESYFSALGRSALRSIFVNYRRNDSEGEAGRLFDDLTSHFSDKSVFMDVAAIEPGRDFRKAIDQSVAACSILLAVIGQEWLGAKDAAGRRRLDDPNDFVRIELASALRRDIPVVPVLVRGAKMPHVDQLPDDLKELAYRNAVELTHARWKSDVQVLIRALRPHMDETAANPSEADRADEEKGTVGHGQQSSRTQPNVPGHDTTAVARTIEPKTVERVSKELAAYIGPISEVFVKRAAKRCTSVEDLYETVAREIEAEADRAKFLRSRRV
jgi:hypothetical protein